ncbi:Membrane-bound lytic murein transglycosylase D [hydrothermal vent metagenome]|uniref:Membrane-bound lytic murein transglycosylase D n=1 Tax=hydrothermal vent metagenome TaxID=652676 RepID=A0A3B0W9K7_9ZZZZ
MSFNVEKFTLLKSITIILFSLVVLISCNKTKNESNENIPETKIDVAAEKTAQAKIPEPPAIPVEHIEFDQFEDLYLSTEATLSIWPRIRAGFQLPEDIEHPSLQNEINWFAKHKKYMQRVMYRADPFLHYIVEEAEKRHLPTELVLLPIVESAYQPFAYSHGRAAGIWQFIPATGRLYGLKQNWWYDGRRDIYASTQAALNYLENLNKLFKGDWMLALAAYNSGSGTVQRAVRRNKKLNLPTDFWHLRLPKETRAYVPKLLALKEIISNPELYSISLRCISDAPGFKQVKVSAQIDLALAAELAELDMETLYNYNPAFNRWATDPDGPHTLILPVASAEIFEKNYSELPADKHLRWTRHKIKQGETLGHLAVKYNTSVKHLRKVNNIRGNNIRAGKYIMIPVSSKNNASYALSSTQRLKATQNIKRGNNTRINHIVQNGESFWTISRKYNVNMHKLAKWNGMAIKDRLKKRQKLVIWTSNATSSRKSTLVKTHNPNGTIKSIHYTVRNGDSLSRIANKYRVKVEDLHRWNAIKGKYLQPGQRLKLYIDVKEQSGRQG